MTDSDHERDPLWYLEEQNPEEKKKPVKLEGKDYIAIFIASLETIFLPIVVMLLVMFAITILFAIL